MARAAATLLLALVAACAPRDTRPVDPVARAAALMAGQFDSRAQAAADPAYLPVTLAMVPLWPGRGDGHWLYVEQALADAPANPYRQRVYRLRADGAGGVVSEVYVIRDPGRFVRGWETGALADLREADLQPRTGCAVHLQPDGDGFRGGTRGRDCISRLRGSAWASADVVLGPDGLSSWDRGFDPEGRQVWGAAQGPYEFRRRP